MIKAQLADTREENGVRLYLHMKQIWDSERMEQCRKALAEYFINAPTPRTNQFYENMNERVPNFFEDLGSMLKLNLVDERLIYDLMSNGVKDGMKPVSRTSFGFKKTIRNCSRISNICETA